MTSSDIAVIMAAAIKVAGEMHPKNGTHSLDVARTACTIADHCIIKAKQIEAFNNVHENYARG